MNKFIPYVVDTATDCAPITLPVPSTNFSVILFFAGSYAIGYVGVRNTAKVGVAPTAMVNPVEGPLIVPFAG